MSSSDGLFNLPYYKASNGNSHFPDNMHICFQTFQYKNYHSAYSALVSMGMHWKAYGGGKKTANQQQKNKETIENKTNPLCQ